MSCISSIWSLPIHEHQNKVHFMKILGFVGSYCQVSRIGRPDILKFDVQNENTCQQHPHFLWNDDYSLRNDQ